ncbi:hypothetical protein N9P68_00300 [Pseudomonadales bacterium]|nr:hypothetical protein [Pseudomonadales bacterium]
MKKLLGYIIYLALSALIILEMIFYLLPVSNSKKTQPVDAHDLIAHRLESVTATHQTGYSFSHIVEKKINNYGYASNIDFELGKGAKNSLVAIIGDSFVEATQVTNANSFHGKLMSYYPEINFYATGLGGSQLSQYLAFSKFHIDTFNPDKFVFVIIENDFTESLLRYKKVPALHYFRDDGDLVPLYYDPPMIKVVLRESAFIRYLVLDLKIEDRVNQLIGSLDWVIDGDSLESSANTVQKDIELQAAADALRSVDLFLGGLQKIVNGKPVMFVLDGDRSSIYSGRKNRDMSLFEQRAMVYLKERSKDLPNVTILDMHPIFEEKWNESGETFDYDYDYHWNELGHATVAESIVQSSFIDKKYPLLDQTDKNM